MNTIETLQAELAWYALSLLAIELGATHAEPFAEEFIAEHWPVVTKVLQRALDANCED